MKCTIKLIEAVKVNDDKTGARVKGFIPVNTEIIPFKILKWMYDYSGVNTTVTDRGIEVHSWADTTCSANDEFDYVKGCRIAESKAKNKIYRFIRQFSGRMSAYLGNLADYFDDAFMKYDHCADHEEEHLSMLNGYYNDED